MALKFLEREDRYSVYQDDFGQVLHLAHGTKQRLYELSEIDIPALWAEVQGDLNLYAWDWHSTFRTRLTERLIDPDEADEVESCRRCTKPDHTDNMHGVHDGWACERCLDEYAFCQDCDERHISTWTVLGSDNEVCEGCRDRNYTYCNVCNGWRHDEDDGHQHEGCAANCESPQQTFQVRNDGLPPLNNDERVTISLPAGTISAQGIQQIQYALQTAVPMLPYDHTVEERDAYYAERDKFYNLSYRIEEALGDKVQQRDGNYPKRLSRLAHKEFGIKLSPALMSQVGNIASEQSQGQDYEIEVTRDLNQGPEAFAHEDSCWWQSYFEGRCALKTNGGYGLRAFSSQYDDDVTSRAWVMPLKQDEHGNLTPTFETMEPDAFMVFNGYHEGGGWGYAPARIVAHMAGMTYRKVGFLCSPMYVNNDTGYLVAPEEIASKYTDGSLHLSVSRHSRLFEDEQADRKVLVNVA